MSIIYIIFFTDQMQCFIFSFIAMGAETELIFPYNNVPGVGGGPKSAGCSTHPHFANWHYFFKSQRSERTQRKRKG